VFSKAKFGEGIRKIKDEQAIFDRLTPMGLDIDNLEPVLAGLTGRTAIIIISDGWANLGPDPVGEARKIYAKYPNVCIHVISLADRKEGKAILTALNKLNGCSMLVSGCDFKELPIFYTEAAEEAPAPMKESIILRGIHFDFNKYDIKPEWAVVLDEAASTLNEHPEISVVVEGHTDAVGSVPYNQVLSEKRAEAVKSYLVRKGVSSMRLSAEGFGKLKPIADNDTDEGRAMNRRVEIKPE
jgi:OOP family OmpA-OmpF porin